MQVVIAAAVIELLHLNKKKAPGEEIAPGNGNLIVILPSLSFAPGMGF